MSKKSISSHFSHFLPKDPNTDQKNAYFRLVVQLFVILHQHTPEIVLKRINELMQTQDHAKTVSNYILSEFQDILKKFDIPPSEIKVCGERLNGKALKFDVILNTIEEIHSFIGDPWFLADFYENLNARPQDSIASYSQNPPNNKNMDVQTPLKPSRTIYRKNRMQHQRGAFFTPQWLVQQVLESLVEYHNLSKPAKKSDGILTIGDLACGGGNFTLTALDFFGKCSIYGYDIDPIALELATINFAILNKMHNSVPKGSCKYFLLDTLECQNPPQEIIPPQFDILIGNPPWGMDITQYSHLIQNQYPFLLRANQEKSAEEKSRPYNIRDQLDSFALFLAKNLELIKPNGIIALVIPSTILFNPVYEPLRRHLLQNTKILQIDYLGEFIFSNVNLPSIVIYLKKEQPNADHLVQIRINQKPRELAASNDNQTNESLWDRYQLPQSNFAEHQFANFAIFTQNSSAEILRKIDQQAHYTFGDFVINGRGVELGKNGKIYQCPNCQTWNPWPHWRRSLLSEFEEFDLLEPSSIKELKPDSGHDVVVSWTKCNNCKYLIIESSVRNVEKIIVKMPDYNPRIHKEWAPILLGEDVQPYHLANRYYIRLGFDGIKYKSREKYDPAKILLRKTGKGIIGAIDYFKRYTVQVVYQFMMRPKSELETLNPNFTNYSLEFLFGVITSQLMEFYYYNKFANPNQETFPHLIQANVLALPIPIVDFAVQESESLLNYSTIVDTIRKIQEYQRMGLADRIPILLERRDQAVAALYGLKMTEIDWKNGEKG